MVASPIKALSHFKIMHHHLFCKLIEDFWNNYKLKIFSFRNGLFVLFCFVNGGEVTKMTEGSWKDEFLKEKWIQFIHLITKMLVKLTVQIDTLCPGKKKIWLLARFHYQAFKPLLEVA